MCDDDFGSPTELQRRWKFAKNGQKCFACLEVIRPGDRYHLIVQNYEGDLAHFKHCARCWAMCEAIMERAESVRWDLNCGTSWQEAFGQEPPDEVARLAFLTPDEAQAMAVIFRESTGPEAAS